RDAEGGVAVIAIAGRLTLAQGNELRASIRRSATLASGACRIDLAQVEALDSGTAAILVEMQQELTHGGSKAEIVGVQGNVGALGGLFTGRGPRPDERIGERRGGVLAQLGRATLDLLGTMSGVLAFVGETIVEGAGALRAPRSLNWRDIVPIAERTGA